jgi:hypothetical protein
MQVKIDMQMQICYTMSMHVKFYLSTICPGVWPIDRQERLLAAWLAGNPCEPVRYVDEIGPKARRNANGKALTQRANLLRPTTRGVLEMIVLASWRCFAFGGDDLAGAIAAAGARCATLVVLDRGIRIEPNAAGQTVATEIAEFGRMVRHKLTGRTRAEIAEEVRLETEARIELIRPYWPMDAKEHPTPKLLAMAGRKGKAMAYKTAKDHLGPRPVAQRTREIAEAREAGRRAGKPPGRKPKA